MFIVCSTVQLYARNSQIWQFMDPIGFTKRKYPVDCMDQTAFLIQCAQTNLYSMK